MFTFKLLLMVTVLTADLSTTEQAYQDYLQYQTIQTGTISPELATLWQDPQLTGKPYSILQAASGKQTYLRFIETEKRAISQQPGWTAIELLTQNVDKLEIDLNPATNPSSPFTIRGPPAWLTDKQNVRAMQVTGPTGEMLYFSQIKDPSKMLTSNQQADSYVDQTFIMVAGSYDFEETLKFYSEELSLKPIGPFPYKVAVLADQLSLPQDTLFDLSLVKVTDTFAIEVDKYPSNPIEHHSPIHSISLVASIKSDAGNNKGQAIKSFPYHNRSVVMLTGNAGEKIEVIIE
jgi:hypothetical protein